MDAVFLRKHIGECLSTCLAEVAEKRPQDPIEYIGQWLHNYIKNQKYLKEKSLEDKKLNDERAEFELEEKRKAAMASEAEQFSKIEAEAKQVEESNKTTDDNSTSKLPTLEEGDEPKSSPSAEKE
ncbi:hypothetical protein SNE40_019013 [Patella caerulea]|uniref:DPY30 domain-containing protein 2 n=1 Tax=Patella caerulea TaxID=87958 RepID=A0AAN8P515_PATCE